MAKRNKIMPRGSVELQSRLEASIDTIRALNSAYDEGRFGVAASIATEIHKVCVDTLRLLGVRREFNFLSTARTLNPENVLAESALCNFDIHIEGGDAGFGGHVEFVGWFAERDPSTVPRSWKRFNEWWNEPILQGSLAPTMGGLVPVEPHKRVSNENRTKLSRFRFLQAIRNELGAHTDAQISDFIAFVELRSFHGFEFEIISKSGQSYQVFGEPELFPHRNTVADATVRQISYELLESLDCRR